jgi:hypothetical protein
VADRHQTEPGHANGVARAAAAADARPGLHLPIDWSRVWSTLLVLGVVAAIGGTATALVKVRDHDTAVKAIAPLKEDVTELQQSDAVNAERYRHIEKSLRRLERATGATP